MRHSGLRIGMPNFVDDAGTDAFQCPRTRNGVIPMKMVKSLVKKFKKNEDLANHAWILHVI